MSVAPAQSQGAYFAITAAVAGITGAIGTALGGFLAQLTCMGGLPGLFALSAVLRLVALLPLVFVREHRSVRLSELMREMTLGIGALLLRSRKNIVFLPSRPQPVQIQAVELGDSVKIGSRE